MSMVALMEPNDAVDPRGADPGAVSSNSRSPKQPASSSVRGRKYFMATADRNRAYRDTYTSNVPAVTIRLVVTPAAAVALSGESAKKLK